VFRYAVTGFRAGIFYPEGYTLDNLTNENTTYLIPDFFSPRESMSCVKKIHSLIFEFELFGWYTDDKLWPRERNWKMFQQWFNIEINSEVFDLVNGKLEKEDL